MKKSPQDAAVKRGLGRRNQAEPVDEYHPDDGKTKDGFYLKDSDDDEVDGNYSDYSDEYYDEVDGGERENTSKHQTKRKVAKEDYVPKEGKLKNDVDSKKFSIQKETMGSRGVSNTVNNQVNKIAKTLDDRRKLNKDKDRMRATVDDCLDERTMEIMTKLINNEKLTEFAGCIATGKEANVYMGHGSYDFEKRKPLEYDEDFDIPVRDYAIKIFKTSVCTFKDRERYVAGEFRFRHGGYKKNPRKMIQMWAEKEVRNLKRIALTSEGLIKSPWPHFLKNNVIVMDFIGHIESRPTMPALDGEEEKDVPHETRHKAAPRLRDAHVEDWVNAYEQTLLIIRRLYQKCKLIHADLSEYNLLYHDEIVYVIDVSQSVEHDHPMSLDFLRRDCSIIRDFFAKKLQRVVST